MRLSEAGADGACIGQSEAAGLAAAVHPAGHQRQARGGRPTQANNAFLTDNPDKLSHATDSLLQSVENNTTDPFYQPAYKLAAR